MKKILLCALMACAPTLHAALPELSEKQLTEIGNRVYMNETAGKIDNLIFWSPNEPFPSLGIAHFIWYPKGHSDIFEESFPKLVERYKKLGIKLPNILEENAHAPWPNRDAFLAVKDSAEVAELRSFLDNTRDVQAQALYERLDGIKDRLMAASRQPDHVAAQFERVVNDKQGAYALIDYLNFKGEGIKETERFNGKGWGLLQVLENMKGSAKDATVMREFAGSAIVVLAQRSLNAAQDVRFNADPDAKQSVETGYMPGFSRRALTYMGIGL